jgi:hypothetical protein
MRPRVYSAVWCTLAGVALLAITAAAASAQGGCQPVTTVDLPKTNATVAGSFTIGGWSVDTATASGSQSGIQDVVIYRDGDANGSGVLLGHGTKVARPDVDATLGLSNAQTGWNLNVDFSSLPTGSHSLYVYAVTSCGMSSPSVVPVTVGSSMEVNIDSPVSGQVLGAGTRVVIGGWAADPASTSGTGIDMVNVYADGLADQGGTLLGPATVGKPRPDVAAAKGKPQWTNSGYDLSWNATTLANGPHTLYVYAHSATTGLWSYRTVDVSISGGGSTNASSSGTSGSGYSSGGGATASGGNYYNGYNNPYNNGYYNNGYYNGYNNVYGNNYGNCSNGYYWNGYQCTYSGSNSNCGNGYYYNGYQCTYNGYSGGSGNCQSGYYWNGYQCVYNGYSGGSGNCQSGYYWNGYQCVYNGTSGSYGNCQYGYYWNGYQCVYNGTSSGYGNCQYGYYWNGSQCIYTGTSSGACPAGYYLSGTTCVYSGGNYQNCPAGYYYNGSQCTYSGSTGGCPAGYVLSGSQCIYTGGTGTGYGNCQVGYTWNGYQCVYSGSYYGYGNCPSGYVYVSGQCYQSY